MVKLLLKVGPSDRFPNCTRVNPATKNNQAIKEASKKDTLKLLLNDPRVEALF